MKSIALPFAAGMIVGSVALIHDRADWAIGQPGSSISRSLTGIAIVQGEHRAPDSPARNTAGCTRQPGSTEPVGSATILIAGNGGIAGDCPVRIERAHDSR